MILLEKKVFNPSSSKVFVVSTFQFSCNFLSTKNQGYLEICLRNQGYLEIFGNMFESLHIVP